MDIDKKHKRNMEIVKNKLTCSAHSLDHVYRVYNLCLLNAKHEEVIDLKI